ncbi:bifunctional 2-C-methyl-D-erythritol 4-phosphate cytidylyltransferase/2-C-methyl-D-erythritol 2,4-cyclodiphosphate synthase [Devosia rhodophyticola]|uniref:Bifunctional enzyme IspD/IspF n=1 Tax=Devosia rhodophyticola TaxID=3026423 RepID=A0ABY7YWQ6_9HYPH|nr:bifunctional 2-C-methyl-D-erythritol 4-phosphate cytidylyltransferase/2-C-methyl-D-erythritol 2,4-cyclodiphosphate synthase [Devosia rhodophyticola]WDR05796.1 bifunctional 2-C-methyl-D-erythritol 4-phosphate cytidylyltransferase/2-C-methyl-D-erythritol 2,4-cyclodiphosphate synthase [Devosia rhodophyticola]
MRSRSIAVIVVAAGRGERASISGNEPPKQYRPINGVPMLSRTIQAFLALPNISLVLPVIHADHAKRYDELHSDDPRLSGPVVGGTTRQASVLAGLQFLVNTPPDLVLIHDAARPFVEPAVIEAVIAALDVSDASLPAIAVTDTIKRSDGQRVLATEDRRTLFAAQTPQGFRFPAILSAHLRASAAPQQFTDDAEIAEWAGMHVSLTPGSHRNIKITHAEDFNRATNLVENTMQMETRVGTGFDVHAFENGESVWLGGIEIPHDRKLKGHSDADVALHALTDAIYGALGEGDIGSHFPPSDEQWRGAASSIFLQHAVAMIAARSGRIVNLDVTIVCEKPKIGPHVADMRARIAEICQISASRVAIKATTSEQLGFTGREEGIVAMASASIEIPRQD